MSNLSKNEEYHPQGINVQISVPKQDQMMTSSMGIAKLNYAIL